AAARRRRLRPPRLPHLRPRHLHAHHHRHLPPRALPLRAPGLHLDLRPAQGLRRPVRLPPAAHHERRVRPRPRPAGLLRRRGRPLQRLHLLRRPLPRRLPVRLAPAGAHGPGHRHLRRPVRLRQRHEHRHRARLHRPHVQDAAVRPVLRHHVHRRVVCLPDRHPRRREHRRGQRRGLRQPHHLCERRLCRCRRVPARGQGECVGSEELAGHVL
ncbi:hypothetical protein E4U41_002973, partial [Claviceps citrina]